MGDIKTVFTAMLSQFWNNSFQRHLSRCQIEGTAHTQFCPFPQMFEGSMEIFSISKTTINLHWICKVISSYLGLITTICLSFIV